MIFESLLCFHAEAAAPALPGVRIVVGDDEAFARSEAAREFEPFGFRIVEARTGREVLRRVAESSPEAVALDLAMPDGEGLETIQALRQDGYAGVIVAMSAAFAGPLLRTAQLLGADGCLSKPFPRGELARLIARLLVERWSKSGV